MKGPIRDDTAFRIVYGLYDYWYSQGRFAEGETMARRLLSKSQSRPTMERIRLFNVSGILRMQQGEHRDAAIDLRHGLDLARESGNLLVEAKVLCNYALALCRIPRLDEALSSVQRACALWPEHGDLSAHSCNLLNAANVQLVSRDFQGALATLATLREAGVPAALQANTDLTEASLLAFIGQHERAQPVLEDVLLHYIDLGDTRQTLVTLRMLVATLCAQGLHRQAAAVSGLVEQLQSRFTVWQAPCNVELYAQALDQCREALGDAFESEVDLGREVTAEEFGDFLRRRGAPSFESTEDER
jgi:tetratricopeptide (TPR) repeat protein